MIAGKALSAKKSVEAAAGKRIVGSRAPEWSEDGGIVFVGVADWDKKITPAKSDEDPSNVEVWNARDVNVISEQAPRRAIATGTPSPPGTRTRTAWWCSEPTTGRPCNCRAPARARWRSTKRPTTRAACSAATTWTSTKWILGPAPAPKSPPGSFRRCGTAPVAVRLNFKDGDYWLYDLESGTSRDISKPTGANFINTDDDHPSPARPAWGVAGWTRNDASAIVYDQFDLWELPVDGSKPRRLTDGSADQVRHRYVNPEAAVTGGRGGRGGGGPQEPIDLSKPVYVSVYGEWTKKAGFARIAAGKVDRPVWADPPSPACARPRTPTCTHGKSKPSTFRPMPSPPAPT